MSLKHTGNWVKRLPTDIESDGAERFISTPLGIFVYQPSFINPPSVEWSALCQSF